MAQMAIIQHNSKFLAYSWTTGVVEVKPPKRVMTDDDALAYAMFLNRRGMPEEAEAFLDDYCK